MDLRARLLRAGSSPATLMLPPDRDTRPVSALTRVDLPAPLGPSSARISPEQIERLTSETIR